MLQTNLPSNKQFGYFFALVFAIAGAYLGLMNAPAWGLPFVISAAAIVVITILRADFLLPLNKLWMRLGLLLSNVMAPIVLGLIFFGLFTPIACVMRVFRRDELRLKFHKSTSYWITRRHSTQSEFFKNQF